MAAPSKSSATLRPAVDPLPWKALARAAPEYGMGFERRMEPRLPVHTSTTVPACRADRVELLRPDFAGACLALDLAALLAGLLGWPLPLDLARLPDLPRRAAACSASALACALAAAFAAAFAAFAAAFAAAMACFASSSSSALRWVCLRDAAFAVSRAASLSLQRTTKER